MKNTIKIKFMDFWDSFNYKEFIIFKILEKNYHVIIADDADYIIYSCFNDNILKEPENKAVKIFYTGENEVPNFNVCDYGIGYDYINFEDRYFRLPDYYNSETYRLETELMEKKHLDIKDYDSLEKTDFCSFVVSNAAAAKEREQFFFLLNKYKQVNSGGRYLNNIGGAVNNKIEFERRHKFSICFENSSHPGYTTEKIVEAFAAQTIPIYWGDPEICKVFNPKAFVNIKDYPNFETAIQRIIEIDNDNTLYLSMMKEPALLHQKSTYHNTYLQFEKWLCSIIDQPKEIAKRTESGYWHVIYYWHQREMKEAFENPFRFYLSKYNFLYKFIKKILNK